ILLLLSIVVVSIIVLKVVPEFGAFYSQASAELPLSTRVIVAFSEFAGSYIGLMAVAVAALSALFWAWLKRPGNRRTFDRMILSIPMLGAIALKFSTSQAARTLA